uniref:GDNF family receptor alpha-1-like n=1 Tax=Cyprinodon variegatus TaxID=28743 RepID=A0A3Q2CAC6_CYPVA
MFMAYMVVPFVELLPYVLTYAEENLRASRLDCVRASEQCLREQACSTKYRTMRQCVAGGKESNFSRVAGVEARDECRSAMEALKQSPLYNCRCKRGMKKEKNCLRIYWGIYQSLQGNDFLEESPYEPVNKRLSDIFRLFYVSPRICFFHLSGCACALICIFEEKRQTRTKYCA